MDIYLSHEGDIPLNISKNALETIDGMDEQLQSVAIRIKSRKGDFSYHQEIGCALDELVGELMSKNTLRRGELIIQDALANNDLLITTEIKVRGIPINSTEALFVIALSDTFNKESLYTIPFDFTHGLVNVRDAQTIGNR